MAFFLFWLFVFGLIIKWLVNLAIAALKCATVVCISGIGYLLVRRVRGIRDDQV